MALPRWAQVLIGVAIVAVFLGIGAIIAITAWVSQNLEVSTPSSGEATDAFEQVRQQFAGRPPLLELKDGTAHYVEPHVELPAQAPQRLQTLHVLAWEPHDQKLARLSIPFWLLRLKSGSIRFSSYASGLDDHGVSVRPEDLEKHGPGIILDTTTRQGERVLLWTQ